MEKLIIQINATFEALGPLKNGNRLLHHISRRPENPHQYGVAPDLNDVKSTFENFNGYESSFTVTTSNDGNKRLTTELNKNDLIGDGHLNARPSDDFKSLILDVKGTFGIKLDSDFVKYYKSKYKKGKFMILMDGVTISNKLLPDTPLDHWDQLIGWFDRGTDFMNPSNPRITDFECKAITG